MVLACIAIPSLTWVVFGLGVVLIAVAYMVNKAYPNPKLDAWVNVEMKDLFMNVVLLFAFVAFYNASTFVALQFLKVYGSTTVQFSPGSCSLDLLKEVVALLDFITVKKAAIGFVNLFHQVHVFEIFSAYSTKITSIPGIDVSMKIMAGFEMPLQALQMLLTGFSVFMASLQFQIMTLQVIRLIGFDLLLPMAFMLRVFPLTRSAANELLAALFSLTLLLPVLYLIFFNSLDEVFVTMGEKSLFKPDAVHSTFSNVLQTLSLIFLRYGLVYNIFFSAVSYTLKEVAYYFVVSVLVPSLVFSIAITAIKSFVEVLRFQAG